MGILDDAIREHLELKRAHGANEQEVRHKEAEAFGPVRTDVVVEAPAAEETQLLEAADLPPAPADDAPQAEPDDPYAVHPGDEAVPDPHHEGEPGGKDPAWGDDTDVFSEPPAAPAAPDLPPEPAPQPAAPEAPIAPAQPDEHRRVFDTDEHLHAGSEPPQPVYGHQAEVAPPPVEEPTQPHEPVPLEEPEPAEGEPGEDDDEDVLEETPEFLQDAPEHDRLWFEQKPPRDFDFGE